jgi:hypothetical protein
VDRVHYKYKYITVMPSRSWVVFAECIFELLYHAVGLQHCAGSVGMIGFGEFVDLAVVTGET